MLKSSKTITAMFLAGMMWAGGCDNSEQSPAAPQTPPAPVPAPQPQAGGAVDAAKGAVEGAGQKATEAASALATEAQKYVDQVSEYVKDKKWDLAEQALTKLEAMKDKLPAEWAAKIADARKMLDTAKKAVGAAPAGGGAGGQ
jgi:hypothetical protein